MRRPIIFTSIFPPSIFKQFPSNRFRNMPYRSSATFFLSRFDDLQARACDDEIVQRPRRVPPSFLFPLMCIEIVISSCIVCSAFFLLFGWPFDERCLPPWLNTPRSWSAITKKKKKKPVLCEKSCDGGPLVVAQRKIFSPFKPPSTIATVNIRKHPVSMHGAELFYPDDYNALLFYSTPEMNCARCTQ